MIHNPMTSILRRRGKFGYGYMRKKPKWRQRKRLEGYIYKLRISSNHQKRIRDKIQFFPREHDITNTFISDFQHPKLF